MRLSYSFRVPYFKQATFVVRPFSYKRIKLSMVYGPLMKVNIKFKRFTASFFIANNRTKVTSLHIIVTNVATE